MKNNFPRSSFGQALIIMLLVMAAVLTLGLAASRQITTDIKITRQQEESAKAYSAAEAGIEKALSTGETAPLFLETNVSTTVTKEEIGKKDKFGWPNPIAKGDGMILWLASHNDAGEIDYSYIYDKPLKICFQQEKGDTAPAIFVALFYNGGQGIKYWAFDPAGRGNNFESINEGVCDNIEGKSFSYSKTVDASGVLRPAFLWIRTFYADHTLLAFDNKASGKNFPSQGTLFVSTGQVAPTGAANVVSRRLVSIQTFEQPPQILFKPLVGFAGIEVIKE